jgi:sugar lactone lactonase YvrE
MADLTFTPIDAPASLLGESPFWHPDEQALYWCDIPGRALHRYAPAGGLHRQWPLEAEPGCVAPLPGGRLLLAMRDGLFRFAIDTGRREAVAPPPYDPATQRFNDGKADPQGRFWVGTIDDRREPLAALYCLVDDAFERRADASRPATASRGALTAARSTGPTRRSTACSRWMSTPRTARSRDNA